MEHFQRHGFTLVHSVSEIVPWNDFYTTVSQTLGEGSYGTVCSVKGIPGKRDDAPRAMKTMSKRPKGMKSEEAVAAYIQRCRAEVEIMRMLDHPSIVRLVETFEDAKFCYLIMERCNGGELFDKIIELGSFTERQAGVLMRNALSAIFYCHSHKICHRDLKPENFLFQHPAIDIENNPIKIIDFGLACRFEDGVFLKTKAGTPYYVAPEVLTGRYAQKCDVWSLGVIIYVLLAGYPPFYGDDDQQILAMVRKGKFDFPPEEWSGISPAAMEVITEMLVVDPEKRMSAEAAYNHTWTQSKELPCTNLQTDFIKKLKSFHNTNSLKKMALTIIAHSLQEEEIKSMKETFQALDTNGDGVLSLDEIQKGMVQCGVDIPENFTSVLRSLDSDGSGSIEYTEFLAATLSEAQSKCEHTCWTAFKVFDLDGDGKITQAELREVLKTGVSGIDAQKMIEENDLDGDGEIDFEEFMAMMWKS